MISNNLIIKTLFALIVSTLFMQGAQARDGQMSKEQMQQMMQHAGKMQDCFANIDQSAMQAMAARARKTEAEIKALCKAGKRDQARDVAMSYAREANGSKEMQAMKKCGTMAQQMMKSSPWMVSNNGTNARGGDICDGM